MSEDKVIQIDLQQVLASKLGARARFVPKWLVRRLQKVIRQDELNEILRLNRGKTGAEFCDGTLGYLNAGVTVDDAALLPARDDSRVIFVCNHPLGGLDGIALISLLSHRYGTGVRFVVNDLLMAVEPLRDVFLPVNKHGRQSRESIEDINRVMEGDAPVLVFPAGLVSRRGRDGRVRDLDWHKMFVNKAVQYRRDVVPLFFSGQNSRKFYRTANLRKRMGLKFNIEMVLLPAEMLDARDSTFRVYVGDRIPWQTLLEGRDANTCARDIKEKVYQLSPDQA